MLNLLEGEFSNLLKKLNYESFKNKKFLITGANGLIGSYLIDFLIYLNEKFDLNINIYAVSRNKTKLLTRFGTEKKGLILLEQDLNNALDFELKPDFIVHAASNAHPLVFSQDPVGTMKTNLLGTINLLDSIKNTGCKFLYISSGEIYGNNTDHAFTEKDNGNIDSKLLRSCYPESKRAAETLCMAYAEQYNIHVNIARLCYVYGPTITDSNSRADAQFLRNVLDGQDIVMKSEGLQKRTYCYVGDAVSAILHILINSENKEVYNVANPNSIATVREYAQTLANVGNVKLKFEIPNAIESKGYSKQADSILDSQKLIDTGWEPMYDLQKGLQHTFDIRRNLNESKRNS